MNKALWIAITVVALFAVTVIPATAAGDKNQHRWDGARFALVGEVLAVDTELQTITVQVSKGNYQVEDYVGQELVITTAGARILPYGECPKEPIGLEDIEVGTYVSANGNVVADEEGDVFQATRVTVDVPPPTEE
jgi:hypothetical protein